MASTEKDDNSTAAPTDDKPVKKRSRKKLLYKKVSEQLEFYFSDSNLSHDRFFKKEYDTAPDGYIPLELFMNFNKIKEMGVSAEDIGKAVSACSTQLCLSDDKYRVKRKSPYKPPENVDGRTVYVEGLPKTADHSWVKAELSVYGTVNYISLPKYASTGQIKGFAFVEFAAEQEASQCLASIGTKEFTSVHPFPKAGSRDIQRLQKATGKTANESNQKRGAKRKSLPADTSSSEDKDVPKNEPQSVEKSEEPVKKKKVKKESTQIPPAESQSTPESKSSRKRKRKLSSTKSDENPGESLAETPSKKLHKDTERRKSIDCKKSMVSAKVSIAKKNGSTNQSKPFSRKDVKNKDARSKDVKNEKAKSLLKAISKSDWMKLKKEYLALQKANMAALKNQLKSLKPKDSKNESPSLEHTQTQEPKQLSSLEMLPGCVVAIRSDEDILNRAAIKSNVPDGVKISYIDLPEAGTAGYIRCASADDASELLKALFADQYHMSLVQGEEEAAYWAKLNQQRLDKRKNTGNAKPAKKRGSEKILNKYEKVMTKAKSKHVVFDD